MSEYKDITLIMQEIEQGKKNLRFKNTEYAEVFSSALAFFQGVIDRVPEADVEPVVKCDVCLYQGKCTVEEAFDTARFPDSKKFCAVGVANRIKEKNGR